MQFSGFWYIQTVMHLSPYSCSVVICSMVYSCLLALVGLESFQCFITLLVFCLVVPSIMKVELKSWVYHCWIVYLSLQFCQLLLHIVWGSLFSLCIFTVYYIFIVDWQFYLYKMSLYVVWLLQSYSSFHSRLFLVCMERDIPYYIYKIYIISSICYLIPY